MTKIVDFTLKCIFFSGSCLLSYWYFLDKNPVVDIYSISIQPEVLRVGDNATVKYDVFKYRNCPLTVSRYFENDGITIYENSYTTAADNLTGPQTFKSIVTIPRTLFEGEWSYSAILTYHCNPIQDITVYGPKVKFTIVK